MLKNRKINLGNLSNIIKGFSSTIIRIKFIQNKLEELGIKVMVDRYLSLSDKEQ